MLIKLLSIDNRGRAVHLLSVGTKRRDNKKRQRAKPDLAEINWRRDLPLKGPSHPYKVFKANDYRDRMGKNMTATTTGTFQNPDNYAGGAGGMNNPNQGGNP